MMTGVRRWMMFLERRRVVCWRERRIRCEACVFLVRSLVDFWSYWRLRMDDAGQEGRIEILM